MISRISIKYSKPSGLPQAPAKGFRRRRGAAAAAMLRKADRARADVQFLRRPGEVYIGIPVAV